MAPKTYELFSCMFFFFLLLALLSHGETEVPKGNNGNEISSAFGFILKLEGCQKGHENVTDLHHLKEYLNKFGYLEHRHNSNNLENVSAGVDDFDVPLEEAIKTYQLNYDLEPTGKLDGPTVSMMVMPRCGVADIINGTNWMADGGGKYSVYGSSFYSFMTGGRKWRARTSTTHITYGFLPNTNPIFKPPVIRAFEKWSAATSRRFIFSQARTLSSADVKISAASRRHGDGFPFDGRGGTLAHAWGPPYGFFHIDADEVWSDGARAGAYDIESTALHEIGHLLGLGHSSVRKAIMFPSIGPGVVQTLNVDDIRGVKALYNLH